MWWFVIMLSCVGMRPGFAQSEGLPSNTHALVYSTTAAELFFTPAADHQVSITHNGTDLGVTDARSRWFDGLDSNIEHRFELRGVHRQSGAVSSTVAVVTVYTGDFSPPVYRVNAANTLGDTNPATVTVATVQPQPNPEPVVQPPVTAPEIAGACNVSSISELISCVNRANQFDRIQVRSDLDCRDGNCCPSGNAIVNLRSVNQLTIDGNGKRLLRTKGQRQCSLIDLAGGSDIRIQNWVLDDDINTQPCVVNDNCPRMLHIKNAANVSLDNVTVLNGKGYTIYVDQVNGFQFVNSRLINSGVLGLYIGHGNRASTQVRVENSTFVDNQTNALALLGVKGNDPSTNVVRGNRFFRNHRRGQWPVAPQYGTGLTGGGQVYIAQASGVTFENNQIRDGYCDNCFVQNRARSGVTGLELGIPGRSTVEKLLIRNNTIENNDAFGVHGNRNSVMPASVVVENNRLASNMVGIGIEGGSTANNLVHDTRWFQSFEGGNDLNSVFRVESSCAGGQVQRVCGTKDARHGSCVAKVTTTNDCSASPVRLISEAQSVKAGQQVQASAWVKGTAGAWCLRFMDASNSVIQERCEPLTDTTPSSVGNLLGTPPLSVSVPNGANRVSAVLQVTQGGASVVIDDVKLSGF